MRCPPRRKEISPRRLCWNGKLAVNGRGWECRRIRAFPLLGRCVWMLWKSRPLCRTRMRQTRAQCGSGPASHITRRLFTGVFKPPVGDVGNRGPLAGRSQEFSKTPQLHSQDLENRAAAQLPLLQSLRKNFHFSCLTTGTTVFFFLYSLPFPTRRILHGSRDPDLPRIELPDPPLRCKPTRPSQTYPAHWIVARNSDMCPVFHPHREAEHEYNQKQKKRQALPRGSNVL